jgi:hypothetical protein
LISRYALSTSSPPHPPRQNTPPPAKDGFHLGQIGLVRADAKCFQSYPALKKNINLFFTIYEKNQSLFASEGLFNLSSEAVSSVVSESDR